MDVRNPVHINYVLELCKRNGQFYNPVYMHLNLLVPPLVKKQFRNDQDTMYRYREMVRDAKAIRQVYDTRGVFTLVGSKVVGFLLYHLQIKDSTPDAQLLYVMVARKYRRQNHGSEMLKFVIEKHMTDGVKQDLHEIESGEKKAIEEDDEELLFEFATKKEQRTHNGTELVAWISCSIERNESLEDNLAFYLRNGFTDKSNLLGWEIVDQPDPVNFKSVIFAGNRKYAESNL